MPRLSFTLNVEELLTHLNCFVDWRGKFTFDEDICLMSHLRLMDSACLLQGALGL